MQSAQIPLSRCLNAMEELTIRDLMKALQKYPMDARVVVRFDHDNTYITKTSYDKNKNIVYVNAR